MNAKKMLTFRIIQPFSLKERMRILFGAVLCHEIACEVSAGLEEGKVLIADNAPTLRTMLGKPQKAP